MDQLQLQLDQIADQAGQLCLDLIDRATLQPGDLVVLGLSSSEVQGQEIGHHSNQEIGLAIVSRIHQILKDQGLELAVQACEHLNRALVVERRLARERGLEIVSVIPALKAGGAGSVAAWQCLSDPVCVEFIQAQAGIDIGDTAIGMHVKHVQVPLRLSQKSLGLAHVTALYSRPKLIGGARAQYA